MNDKNIDDAKGRAKEAAGALTGDDEMKESGQDDQRAAEAKEKVDDLADRVKDGVDDVKRRLSD